MEEERIRGRGERRPNEGGDLAKLLRSSRSPVGGNLVEDAVGREKKVRSLWTSLEEGEKE